MGTWDMNVPQVTAHENVLAANTTLTTPPSNLIAQCSPTMMELWALDAVYVPCALLVQPKVAPTAAWFVTVTFRLLYGGDIAFADSVMETFPAEAGLQQRNILFAVSLQNAIEVQRGRTLTATLSAISSVAVEGISIGMSADVISGSSNAYTLDIGTITYNSKKLSGHREL